MQADGHVADDRSPIFIVGLPRSGTTLLASMLDAHSALDCGPETFFFAQLPSNPAVLVAPDGWPDRATDFVCGLRMRRGDRPVHELFGRSREDISQSLGGRQPGLAPMLESLTRARADAKGKRRWAEKTPRHLGHLPLIRETFPDAAIIRVVRDPRASALSMTRVPFASSSLLANLYTCERTDAAVAAALNRDSWLLTIRFEDLVADPDEQLRRVCDFVGEGFEPGMLGPRTNAGLAAEHETWKRKAAEPPDLARADAWRAEMSISDQRAAAVICHDMLVRHRYPGARPPRRAVIVEPDGFVHRQEDAVRRLAIGGVIVRRRRGGRSGLPVDVAFWSDTGDDPWHLGHTTTGRLRAYGRMALILARSRALRRTAVWVTEERSTRRRGAAETLLRLLATIRAPDAWLASLGASPEEPGVAAEDVR